MMAYGLSLSVGQFYWGVGGSMLENMLLRRFWVVMLQNHQEILRKYAIFPYLTRH